VLFSWNNNKPRVGNEPIKAGSAIKNYKVISFFYHKVMSFKSSLTIIPFKIVGFKIALKCYKTLDSWFDG
jgi:hypothetical protein